MYNSPTGFPSYYSVAPQPTVQTPLAPSYYSFAPQPTQTSSSQFSQPQATQPQQMTPPMIHTDIIQVEDITVPDNYSVAPGTAQMFMTKDEKYICIKNAYANGSHQTINYVREEPTPKQTYDMDSFATKDEIDKLYKKLTEFEKKLSEISYKPNNNNNNNSQKNKSGSGN